MRHELARVLSGSGQPLDPEPRLRLEHGFGADLGDVRLHTDGAAAESARRAGARAYTVGSDVVFGAGRYRPDDTAGWRLLSHEMAHVLQQRGEGAQPGPLNRASESNERAARGAADALVRGESAPKLDSSSGLVLARDDLSVEDFEEPESQVTPAKPADEEESDLTAKHATPFSAQVSAVDPSIIFVPVESSREEIGRELGVDASRFYIVGAAESRPPSEDVQGIRFYDPADIPTALTTKIRARLEATLPGDVEATLDALVAESGGWSATQYALRWMQYSR